MDSRCVRPASTVPYCAYVYITDYDVAPVGRPPLIIEANYTAL